MKLNLIGEVDVDALADAIPDAIACGPMVRHLDVSYDELTTVIDVEAMTNKVDLPMGLREIRVLSYQNLRMLKGMKR